MTKRRPPVFIFKNNLIDCRGIVFQLPNFNNGWGIVLKKEQFLIEEQLDDV
jgi:hypothetical protein